MTKSQLIAALVNDKGYKKYAITGAVEDIIDAVTQALGRGEKVTLCGFGTFEAKDYKGHPGTHPRTHEPIDIPDFRTVTFRPGRELARVVKQ